MNNILHLKTFIMVSILTEVSAVSASVPQDGGREAGWRESPSDHLSYVEDSSDDTKLTEDEVSAHIDLKPPEVDSLHVLLWWKEGASKDLLQPDNSQTFFLFRWICDPRKPDRKSM